MEQHLIIDDKVDSTVAPLDHDLEWNVELEAEELCAVLVHSHADSKDRQSFLFKVERQTDLEEKISDWNVEIISLNEGNFLGNLRVTGIALFLFFFFLFRCYRSLYSRLRK
jgi:hypothetical protein